MATAGALLSSIGFTIVAIIIVFIALLYTLRLQRKALVTQTAVVEDHFAEKNQRQRQLELAEEAVAMQKRAMAHDEEALALLRRSVELNEQILHALRDRR
ncbi:MAG TPA: hypothetical protein VF004_07850 [Burkholderiales bacterium]